MSRAPKHIVFVDTETRNQDGAIGVGEHRLDFGVAISRRWQRSDSEIVTRETRLRFTESTVFWKWLDAGIRQTQSVWVMAHNWNFDGAILSTITYMRDAGWELDKYINEKPPVIIRWSHKETRRHITLVDTLNYFTSSLKSLGIAVGLDKLEMPDADATDADWDTYAWRDVEIIADVFTMFRSLVLRHSLGGLQPTLASQAFASWRTRFIPECVDIYVHDRERLLRLERAAYHGGRTEAFYAGNPGVMLHKLDINSHYPAQMLQRKYPVEPLDYHYESCTSGDLANALIQGLAVTAHVTIRTDLPAYPVKLDRLLFPTGTFRTVLTTPEIEFALDHGHIIDIESFATYRKADIFSEYVSFFYGMRQQYKTDGNGAFDYMCKILLNSLYGKFGQSGRKWTELGLDLPPDTLFYQEDADADTPVLRVRHILGQTQYLQQEPESENSIPNIAAEITAAGRIELYRLILEACTNPLNGEMEDRVYYCDTDSLVVDDVGLSRLNRHMSAELGGLKLEGSTDDAEFHAPKHYRFGNEWHIKGIRQTAERVSEDTYRQDKFNSWDAHIKRGDADGHILIEKLDKRLTKTNSKAILGDDSWFRPISLEGVQQSLQT